MLFKYKAIDNEGTQKIGTIDALNVDVAISSLQQRGLIISSVQPVENAGKLSFSNISFFERVSNKDVVILSRQISTLFEAQVSALRVFKLLAAETPNRALGRTLAEVGDDLQGGSSITKALAKHPKVFSNFYVNMVRAGEEAGKLDETFLYLADYLDRTYEITSKARNALIYPAFVVFVFITVMVLMLTMVIPKISTILVESGQEIPTYTKVVMALSNFFTTYGLFLLVIVILLALFGWRYLTTGKGRLALDRFKLGIPILNNLYRKLYLARISDNLHTMLVSGIPMVKAIDITATVVDNKVFENILLTASEGVRTGSALSDSLDRFDEMPSILIQMVRVGEETGELGNILKTLAAFYRREITNAVDTLVGLIEPIMIAFLGLGVGVLLASVLIPIYNVATNI